MNESQVLKALAALSEQTRLRIVRYLITCGENGAAAGDIGGEVSASSSRTSFHMTTLENAGLVTSERISRNIIYRINFSAMGDLMAFMLKDCCQGHPDVIACCNRAHEKGRT